MKDLTHATTPEGAPPSAAPDTAYIDAAPDTAYIDLYTTYANSCLGEVHPDYHLLTGLVVQAALLGSKLRTATNLKPNMAGLIVAFSGIGKGQSTRIGIDLLEELVRQEILEHSPIIATHCTVEGLLEALQNKPTGLIDLDEFGGFLKDCQRDHMSSARENFCRAIDGRQIKYVRARNKNVIVEEPCPSIIGTVNMGPLRQYASNEDLIGGLFSRFLIVAPDVDFLLAQPKAGDGELHKRLLGIMEQWIRMEPQIIEIPPAQQEAVREYAYSVSPYQKGQKIYLEEIADDTDAAFTRYNTHVLKVAMLLAAGEVPLPKAISVTEDHVERAIRIVERFRGYAERVFKHLQDADDTHLIKRVTKIMESGKRMTFSELHQKIGGRTKAKDLRDAIEHLKTQGFMRDSSEKPGQLIWSPRN